MNITEQTSVGQLVALDYRAAAVFKNYGIDFCCNGNRSIAEACEKKQVEPATLINNLTAVTLQPAGNTAIADFNFWEIDLLADYIEKKHHRYVVAKIQEIVPFLNKVTSVHGSRHPELAEIKQLFLSCADELLRHMQKEELVLFPYVRAMVAGTKSAAPFGTIQNPIKMMMQEHSTEGDRLRKIAELSGNYTPPEDACTTYRVTFALLNEFEEDLHLHIHLENNILFPKAIAMEQKMVQDDTSKNSCQVDFRK